MLYRSHYISILSFNVQYVSFTFQFSWATIPSRRLFILKGIWYFVRFIIIYSISILVLIFTSDFRNFIIILYTVLFQCSRIYIFTVSNLLSSQKLYAIFQANFYSSYISFNHFPKSPCFPFNTFPPPYSELNPLLKFL